jgi:uncharacterized protein YkwD
MKKIILLFLSIIIALINLPGAKAANDLSGRILIQVENRGEAWYVSPASLKRYYLGRPSDALLIMRQEGIGITDRNIAKIPIAWMESGSKDSDQDGLTDDLEIAIGTNPLDKDSDHDSFSDSEEAKKGYDPLGPGRSPYDLLFADRQKGRILIQAEKRGEAWYVDPSSGRRYFLGRPADAFSIMGKLGLGIKNNELDKVPIAPAAPLKKSDQEDGEKEIAKLEKLIHQKINIERKKNGLPEFKLNNSLSEVAREHSRDLAMENQAFSGTDRSCTYVFIHHEGLKFGLYSYDRLKNRAVSYFSSTGENIALMPAIDLSYDYSLGETAKNEILSCPAEQSRMKKDFDQALAMSKSDAEKIKAVEEEIKKRRIAYERLMAATFSIKNRPAESVAADAVKSWMDSPGHRANILNKDFDEAGIGAAQVSGYYIFTQEFIKRASCGFQDGPCCQKSGYYPYCFTPLKCQNSICVK